MSVLDIHDHQLREHPDSTIARLKKLGVWEDAEKVLRKVKAKFTRKIRRAGGSLTLQRRIELAKFAWDEVQRRWPPPDGTPPLKSLALYVQSTRGSRSRGPDKLPVLGLAAERRFTEIAGSPDLHRDVIWVYEHLHAPDIDPLDCPSRGAWSLLAFARENPEKFYRQHVRPAMAEMAKQKANARDETPRISKHEQMRIEDIRQMLIEAREASKGWPENSTDLDP
jgi:hypothetical protein